MHILCTVSYRWLSVVNPSVPVTQANKRPIIIIIIKLGISITSLIVAAPRKESNFSEIEHLFWKRAAFMLFWKSFSEREQQFFCFSKKEQLFCFSEREQLFWKRETFLILYTFSMTKSKHLVLHEYHCK